jgi:hypothetical protein
VEQEKKLSDLLSALLVKSQDEAMTLGTFIDSVGSQGQALLGLLFSLPFIIVFALPGISTIFGLMIFFSGIRLSIGKGVWIPKRFRTFHIGGPRFYKIFRWVCKFITWIEKFTRPRMPWLFSWRLSGFLQGIMLAIDGLCIALPLPPGTSIPPAIAAATLSLGILEKDGLWVLLGIFFFFVNLGFFVTLFLIGKQILADLLLTS